MKNSNWKATAELIGIGAIVASLLFVGYQLQLDRRIATAQIEISNFESRYAINQLVSDNASIWLRGNAGEELSPEEALVFANIVDSAVRRAFHTSQSLDELGATHRDNNIRSFAIWLYRHPVARRVFYDEHHARREISGSIIDLGQGNFFYSVLFQMLDDLDRTNGQVSQ